MFHSLRWRIIFAFGFIILLAVLVSGVFAVWTTRNQFDELVTEDGLVQAQEIAVFLEAQYNIQGNLNNMPDLLFEFGYLPAADIAFEEEFFEEEFEYEEYFEVWDRIVAAELGLSLDEYEDARYELSIVELAEEEGIEPETLTNAIMRFEQRWVLADEEFDNEDKLFTLTEVLYQAQDFVHNSLPYAEEEEIWVDESTFFIETLLGDSRVFITDENGVVLYDSEDNTLAGEQLDEAFIRQGVSLYDWQNGRSVGHVVVATGEGFYREQEDLFLSNVRQSLVSGGVVAIFLALVVGAFLARQITIPVITLTTAAKRLASGDDPTKLPVTSKDELGEMSQAFNTLTDALDTQKHLRRRLISDISHELNTPLSVIQLEVKALQDGMQSPAEASTQITQEINLLRNLANDLSLLAETDQGELRLDLQPVAMGDFLQTAVSRWQAKAESAQITLRLNAKPNLPTLAIDEVRINQVLGNLIQNGLQHTPAGGTITILSQTNQGWLDVTVADSGIGIAAEDLPFVFERFYCADKSRQRNSGGRGLGLAIVKQIVEAHHGEVFAESQLDTGSRFTFRLPL